MPRPPGARPLWPAPSRARSRRFAPSGPSTSRASRAASRPRWMRRSSRDSWTATPRGASHASAGSPWPPAGWRSGTRGSTAGRRSASSSAPSTAISGRARSSRPDFSGAVWRGLSPMIFPGPGVNSMGAAAAIEIGAKGPTVTLNQATVAGDLAIARAAVLIRSGQADAVVAGGVDEICPPVYRRLAEMGVLAPMGGALPEGSRPFAADHNGPVLGEGATFLVVEALDSAAARGATIHAEVLGALWGNLPVAPHTAPRSRRDRRSPVLPLLAPLRLPPRGPPPAGGGARGGGGRAAPGGAPPAAPPPPPPPPPSSAPPPRWGASSRG